MEDILIIYVIGAIAGWIAGAITNADSGSILLDIFIGIVGGYIGYRLFAHELYITSNVWINKTITATAGAVILSFILKLIRMAFGRRTAH